MSIQLADIRSYHDLSQFMAEHYIVDVDHCLDANEVDQTMVDAFDDRRNGARSGCLETFELMTAVNYLSKSRIFSDRDIDAERNASHVFKDLAKHYYKDQFETSVRYFMGDGETFSQAVNDIQTFIARFDCSAEQLDFSIQEGLEVWNKMRGDGASAQWLTSLYNALDVYYYQSVNSLSGLSNLWEHLRDPEGLHFSPAEAMQAMDNLFKREHQPTSFIAIHTGEVMKIMGYLAPRISDADKRDIILNIPQLLVDQYASNFIGHALPQLKAAEIPNAKIGELYMLARRFCISNDEISNRIGDAANHLNNSKMMNPDAKFTFLKAALSRPDFVSAASELSLFENFEAEGLARFNNPQEAIDLIRFCMDHPSRGYEPGPLETAGKLAAAGWSSEKIKRFIQFYPRETLSPEYYSSSEAAIALEKMGISEGAYFPYFKKMISTGHQPRSSHSDFNNLPAVFELMRKEGLTDVAIGARLTALSLASSTVYGVKYFAAIKNMLEAGIRSDAIELAMRDAKGFYGWDELAAKWVGLKQAGVIDAKAAESLKPFISKSCKS